MRVPTTAMWMLSCHKIYACRNYQRKTLEEEHNPVCDAFVTRFRHYISRTALWVLEEKIRVYIVTLPQ